MSLIKTLTKVAIGVAVAKGVAGMVQKGKTRGGQQTTGGMFGGAHSPNAQAGSGGGLEDLMGSVLGGRGQQQGGGLGGLMEKLGGGAQTGTGSGGGLNDLLGQLGGAGGAAGGGGGLGGLIGGLTKNLGGAAGAGGLGGLLGGLAGAATGGGQPQQPEKSFGDVLNSSFDRMGEPEVAPTPEQDAMAGLLLKAMIQAAKADGEIDPAEKEKLLGKLGDVSQEEMAFVQAELAAPVDIQGLADMVPRGFEKQVYLMSVMGIDLDSTAEAQYLDQLGGALGVGKAEMNDIHQQLGVPVLYS